ncbi:MAG: hypothetical protein WBB29_07450 [Geitlerinemataceae cyanobacterium]
MGNEKLYPENLDRWFSYDRQKHYTAKLIGRVGFTRRRAECFVRLWAYLFLKQQLEVGNALQPPLQDLSLPEGLIPCTHREAAALFYAHQERGSERAAGMMLDKLSALHLVNKHFDGNSICLQINPLPDLNKTSTPEPEIQFQVDAFNPRTDAIPVANFLARNYNWMNNNTATIPQHIARWLRSWAQCYGTGMRVLRRGDNLNAIGFSVFYPTAPESEGCFFQAPSQSLHLSSARANDPILMAKPGDPNCTSVFIRSWAIDRPYNQTPQVCQLLADAQQTLKQMQTDFPNLCDLYALIFHPSYEPLIEALGFQKISQDPQKSIYWVYLAIDRFLELDFKLALLNQSSLRLTNTHT